MKLNFFNFFAPAHFLKRFCFCYGGETGKSESNDASTTSTSSTTVSTTNQQVGASEGSIGVGAGASLNITTSDGETVANAFKFGTSSMKDALFFASEEGSRAAALVSKVLDKNPTPANETNAILQGVSGIVAGNLASASSNVAESNGAMQKNLLTLGGVGIAIFAAIQYFKK